MVSIFNIRMLILILIAVSVGCTESELQNPTSNDGGARGAAHDVENAGTHPTQRQGKGNPPGRNAQGAPRHAPGEEPFPISGAKNTNSAPPPGSAMPTFEGDAVRLKGILKLPSDAPKGAIQIDINGGTGAGQGPLMSTRLDRAGKFSIPVPKNAGTVNMMIYVGVTGTDPGKVGPENIYSWGPIEVGDKDITGIDLDLSTVVLEEGNATAADNSGEAPARNRSDSALPEAQSSRPKGAQREAPAQ